ncbi:MAG: 2-amino-4-hydroxy-6-hydroxymethyldihydropteridine diphosphokinase [Saprospiraceae bacterium]|nr:2-amino-4-hydroxy-6-hydroxymethyldihydropteridine diphosphokinase [Saprospiraceae bacterium]
MGDKKSVYFLLGSNMGQRRSWINKAMALMSERIGQIKEKSSLYETMPWGDPHQQNYLNLVVRIDTSKSASKILQLILDIESALGRVRTVQNAARRIDIDILLYGEMHIDEADLQIPHPRMHERNFTLIPLMEIAGEIIHPVLKKTIEEIFFACKDPLEVVKLNEKTDTL